MLTITALYITDANSIGRKILKHNWLHTQIMTSRIHHGLTLQVNNNTWRPENNSTKNYCPAQFILKKQLLSSSTSSSSFEGGGGGVAT